MSDYKKAIARWKRNVANGGWVAVDLDGTLAHYDAWNGPYSIGTPIPLMVERVIKMLAAGIDVRVFTARADGDPAVVLAIQNWTEHHIGQRLPVTATKDYQMICLYDDRAVQVVPNTGERADGMPDECCYDGMCADCQEEPA